MNLEFKIARSREELEHCFGVRYEVFAEQCGYLDLSRFPDRKESDEMDLLETTTNLLAIDNASHVKPIATMRVLQPNKCVAESRNTIFGLPSEEYFDLIELKDTGILPVDFARSSVLKEYQASPAIVNLWGIAIHYALSKGYTHLLTIANAETDDINEAKMIYTLAKDKGLVHPSIKAYAKKICTREEPYEHRIFEGKKESEIIFPYAMNIYNKIGTRFISEPVYYYDFRMCAFLIMLDLKNINKPLNQLFERAWKNFIKKSQ